MKRIDGLLREFTSGANRVENNLSSMLALVSGGRVPPKSDIQALEQDLARLQKAFDSIQSLASEVVAEGQMPSADASASDYAEAIKQSEVLRIKEQIIEIENRLHRFISVKSLVVAFEEALKPFQSAAQDILSKLDYEVTLSPSELEKATEAHKLFLEAIATEDFDSDAGMELMERLEEHYPSKVQRGLMLNKYYVDEDAGVVEEDGIAQVDIPVAEEVETPTDVEPLVPIAEQTVADPSSVTGDASIPVEVVEAEPENTVLEESEEDPEPLEMVRANTKIKAKAASANAFKNDILKMSHEVCTILPLFTNLGALTADQIYAFGSCMDCFDREETLESVQKTLDALVTKSVAASYSINGFEMPIYCLTSYGYNSLNKYSIAVDMKKIFTLPFGKYRLIAKDEMTVDSLMFPVMHNTFLMMYFGYMKMRLREDVYDLTKKSITWDGEHYTISVFADDSAYKCFVAVMGDDYAALLEKGNILIYEDDINKIEIPSCNNGNKVFAHVGNFVYLWDGKWIEQTKALQVKNDEDDSGEAEPSEEAAFEENNPMEVSPAVESYEEEPVVDAQADVSSINEPILPEMVDCETVSEETPVVAPAEEMDDPVCATTMPVVEPVSVDDKAAAEKSVPDDGSALSLCNILLSGDATPTDEQFVDLIHRLAESSTEEVAHLKEAVLLAKAASFGNRNTQSRCAYDQLILATNMGLDKEHYSGSVLADAFDMEVDFTESCKIAAYLYAMLFPYQAYDHTLKATTQSAAEDYDCVFPNYLSLKALFNKASSVCDVSPEGFSESILDALSDQDKSQAHAEKLKKIAQPLLNEPRIKAHINGIPEFIGICFGKQSDLYLCMEIISANNKAERDFVSAVFTEYCEDGTDNKVISDFAIDSKIDLEWKIATRGKRTNGINLEYQARKQVFNEFVQRLELMKAWLEHSGTKVTANIPAMKKQKSSLTKEICIAKKTMLANPRQYDTIVLWMLDCIQTKLDNEEPNGYLFDDLLRTGLISLDASGVPIMVESMHSVKYAEPWRFVLKHIVAEKPDFEDARDLIFDIASPTFDNLHQLEMIGKSIGSDENDYIITPSQIAEAIESANAYTEQFRDNLELAYTYNRIYEVEKESLTALLDLYHDFYFDIKDFGNWRNFLHCLQQQVDDLSNGRKEALKIRLDACSAKLRAGEKSSLLDEARRLLDVDANFAVTEEYCNRFELGERELTEELTAALHDPDSFSIFLSDEVFQPLYEECIRKSGQRLDKFGPAYVTARYPDGWTSRHKEDSKKLLSVWPNRRGNTSQQQIATFFAGLGFTVRGAEKVPGKRQEVFHLNIDPIARNMPDYIHPISAFGTQIKSPLNVIVLYGKNMAQELVDTISSLNLGGMSIVLIDYPLDRSVRRQIAEIFHTKMSGMNPFLLIDQVLALHLALHQDTERLPVMLKCTLPYTSYQPFVRDGGPTADEMFCGRAGELATIIDPNGACVVYGGRQLGKTALLERAQSLFAKPEAKAFAVYSSILKFKGEDAVVERLIIDIRRMTKIKVADCDTLRELCAQIDALFRNGTISSMLLLIDEADDFLASISGDDYLPLQPLVDLKRESKNQFKFVLAGLHNVCRAKNATARNGIFGQLGQPLCVKPLSPTDALQLISRPLRYLGFQVDRYPHLETILTNTNYYPGILQFFGYTLVQTMTSQYGKYYRAVDGNPPYTLKKEQLGAILNSADLNNSIKDKFRWSLELDPRYFMLARCIAMLYYEHNGEPTSSQLGFSVDQIMDMVSVLEIHCLENETIMNITNLLDEMVDMGILSRPNDTEKRYRLRRKSFINIIGADVDTLLNDIVLNNGEGC